MYSRKIFAVLIILVSARFSFAAVNSIKEIADVGSHLEETVPQLEAVIQRLERSIASERSKPAKVTQIRMALNEIAEIRKQNDLMEMDKEIYFDFLTEPLAQFFDASFKSSKCLEFDYIIRRDYEPSADAAPTNPPVRKAYDMIASVCS